MVPEGGDIVAPDDLVFDAAGDLYVTEYYDARVSVRGPDGRTRVLRDDVPVPMSPAASTSTTSIPDLASFRATARPTTPAPMTTHSILSIGDPLRWINLVLAPFIFSAAQCEALCVRSLLSIDGHLPAFKSHCGRRSIRVYPI